MCVFSTSCAQYASLAIFSGFPLAVKLGTITQDGKGDVYSYDEDDLVLDPYLTKHLAHFGINIGQLEKVRFLLMFLLIS